MQEVGLDWAGPWGWAGRAGSGGAAGQEEFVAGQGGLCQEQKGKLMRGGWADSSPGFLSLRWQLPVNAGLAAGNSCQSVILANLWPQHNVNTARVESDRENQVAPFLFC